MNKSYVSFVLGILCGIAACFLFTSRSHEDRPESIFKFMGNTGETSAIIHKVDSIYAEGVDPNGVYNKERGVIPDPKSAVDIAEIILFPIYGKDNIVRQRPYQVKLSNGHVWNIEGTLSTGHEGGTFHIAIDKCDSRVLTIWHEK